MADNFTFTPGSGAIGAADDILGVLYPRVKFVWGTDGVANDVTIANPFPIQMGGGNYEAVPAGVVSPGQVLGATGASGDFLLGVLVIPGSTSPAAVSIKDGALTAIVIFEGGVGSVGSLVPFFIPVQAVSVNGAWQVITGAGVTVLASGRFTA